MKGKCVNGWGQNTMDCAIHSTRDQKWEQWEAEWVVRFAEQILICSECFLRLLQIAQQDHIGADLAEIERQLQEQGKKETLGDA